MKIIFLSSDEIALPTFYEILKKHEIVAVVTQPDKPHGRSNKLIPSCLAEVCEKEKLKVFKPDKIDFNIINEIKSYNADIFITFAYGIILKKEFFEIAKL